MKILITGAGGMLGTDLSLKLQPLCDLVGLGLHAPMIDLKIPFHSLDLTKTDAARQFIKIQKPEIIFHTAAMTDVDGCEKNPHEALRLNFEATKNVADAAASAGSYLVHFSTDYIFDGNKQSEYQETDSPHPLNVYGETKLLAEKYIHAKAQKAAIFRISWLFGRHGRSFPRTLIERSETTSQFEVVSDQLGRPTYTLDVVAALANLVAQNTLFFKKNGVQTFHLTNSGEPVSWYELAKVIFAAAGLEKVTVKPVLTTPGMRPALRPKNSILALGKAKSELGLELRNWKTAVQEFVHDLITQGTH